MFFYVVKVQYKSKTPFADFTSEHDPKQIDFSRFSEKSYELFLKNDKQSIVCFKDTVFHFCAGNLLVAAVSNIEDIDNCVKEFLDSIGVEYLSFDYEETVAGVFIPQLGQIERDLRRASILPQMKLDLFTGYNSRNLLDGEGIIKNIYGIEEDKNFAEDICSTSFYEELERIYAPAETVGKSFGHPVHYIITAAGETREEIYKHLLSALYDNKRILSKRYLKTDIENYRKNCYGKVYENMKYGTVIFDLDTQDMIKSGMPFETNDTKEKIADMCELASKYRNTVLTLFILPRDDKALKELIFASALTMYFVEIDLEVLFNEKAKSYLAKIAEENEVIPDKKLFELIEKDEGYNITQLTEKYNIWFGENLRKNIYPQYGQFKISADIATKDTAKGNAYDKLNALIGLDSIKKTIESILNKNKFNKIFKERGISKKPQNMHMVFTGNPGTAKTTVARLFAQIMKDNEILPEGSLREVGRADLVGKYVGQTAPLVKKNFRLAKGGVLFIDEAYSLSEHWDGSYGDEAINTIVQEMENNREDTVVIFAGYPDKMEEFLQRNPGLRSRIAYNVDFPDYNEKELTEIAVSIAKDLNLTIDENGVHKLEEIFKTALKQDDFGNGRFARNIIERAVTNQADRLMRLDYESVTDKMLTTLTADDIENTLQKKAETTKIGFM